MNRDVVFVSVECARWDKRDLLDLPRDLTLSRGVTAAPWTRPSMGAMLTGQWASVVNAQAHKPTLAGALCAAGYETRAISYSPQTTADFGFANGFDHCDLLQSDAGPFKRGSNWRERLAEYDSVRWLKRKLRNTHATFENIPRDQCVVDRAVKALEQFDDRPLFLWVHLMGSHRPYGWDDPLPEGYSLAAASGDTQHRDTVVEYYDAALQRVGSHVNTIYDAAHEDSVFVVAGDHGEELGEDGVFFHGGYRRRVVDALVNVPVAVRGIRPANYNLIDLPAYVCHGVGAEQPDWDARRRRDHALTVAPWNDNASIRYQEDGVDLRFHDADRAQLKSSTASVDSGTRSQLQALGYAEVG